MLSVVHVRVDDIRLRCRCDVSVFSLLCVELRRSMVDVSTFEDPIDVRLAMLLHLPGRCVGRRSRIRSIVNFIIILLAVVLELRRGFAL